MGSESSRPALDGKGYTPFKAEEQRPVPTSPPNASGKENSLSHQFEFEGVESKAEGFAGWMNNLVRSDSVDVTNDPRIMSDNVIAHRLTVFNSIIVAAVLICSLAFSAVLVLRPASPSGTKFSWIKYVGLSGMLATMCLNLFCTVIVVQQNYLVNRIATAGSMGFEMAKSLYLNPTYVSLRHIAMSCFFKSIPLFVGSTGMLVWEEISPAGQAYVSNIIISVGLLGIMVAMLAAHRKQKAIFHEKLVKMQAYSLPLQTHIEHELAGPFRRKTLAPTLGLMTPD